MGRIEGQGAVQVLDDEKRQRIELAAVELFAERPFHAVRLEDIAAAAGVGKGTLYVYFAGKDDLYLAVLYRGFAELVDDLAHELGRDAHPPGESLDILVRQFIAFACRHPNLFKLMRALPPTGSRPKWLKKREQLIGLIERTIRRGIAAGIWHDPHPEFTAQFLLGMIRSAMLYGPPEPDRTALEAHVLRFLRAGLSAPVAESRKSPSTRTTKKSARRNAAGKRKPSRD